MIAFIMKHTFTNITVLTPKAHNPLTAIDHQPTYQPTLLFIWTDSNFFHRVPVAQGNS
jgi:hypothetical protein